MAEAERALTLDYGKMQRGLSLNLCNAPAILSGLDSGCSIRAETPPGARPENRNRFSDRIMRKIKVLRRPSASLDPRGATVLTALAAVLEQTERWEWR